MRFPDYLFYIVNVLVQEISKFEVIKIKFYDGLILRVGNIKQFRDIKINF